MGWFLSAVCCGWFACFFGVDAIAEDAVSLQHGRFPGASEWRRSSGEGREGVSACWGALVLDGVEFVFRAPAGVRAESRVVVLFGGRGWPGAKTLDCFDWGEVADRAGWVLLAPSFVDGEYWEPASGSGPLLLRAVGCLEEQLGLRTQGLFLYGFSAGGQCAALFAVFLHGRVDAWGAHACGVFPERRALRGALAPALLTCGCEDAERDGLTRRFGYVYREGGGTCLRKTFPGGHLLQPEALALARAWFLARERGGAPVAFGDDDTGLTVPPERAGEIEEAFRNALDAGEVAGLWLGSGSCAGQRASNSWEP